MAHAIIFVAGGDPIYYGSMSLHVVIPQYYGIAPYNPIVLRCYTMV